MEASSFIIAPRELSGGAFGVRAATEQKVGFATRYRNNLRAMSLCKNPRKTCDFCESLVVLVSFITITLPQRVARELLLLITPCFTDNRGLNPTKILQLNMQYR
jgi:hypothetical protein